MSEHNMSTYFPTCSEKKSVLRIILIVTSRVFLLEHFSDRVMGTCQACYRYYCPSMLAVRQRSVLSLTIVIVWNPSKRSQKQRTTCTKCTCTYSTQVYMNSKIILLALALNLRSPNYTPFVKISRNVSQ